MATRRVERSPHAPDARTALVMPSARSGSDFIHRTPHPLAVPGFRVAQCNVEPRCQALFAATRLGVEFRETGVTPAAATSH
jgi:hypothetical protein